MKTILDFPLESHDSEYVYSQMVSDFLLSGNLRAFKLGLSSTYGTKTARLLHDHIDRIQGSHEARFLWRALAVAIKTGGDFDDICRHCGLNVDTARAVVYLSSNHAYDDIVYLVDEDFVLDILTDTEESAFMSKLAVFTRRVVYTKLKFLAHYDNSVDMEDYVQSLLMKGMQTIWRYSYFTRTDGTRDFLKVLNYAKATISNTAVSIIRGSTLERRARIRNNASKGCGVCGFCSRGNFGGCAQSAPAYESVVAPAEAMATVAAPDVTAAAEARMILAQLISTDPRVARLFAQTFGTVDVNLAISKCSPQSEKKFLAAVENSGYRWAS